MTARLDERPALRDAISVTEAAAKMGESASTVRDLLTRGLIEGYAGGCGTKKPRSASMSTASLTIRQGDR